MSDIKPSAMWKYMEEDERSVSLLTKTARRVKIENNHTWNLRLLPVTFGADGMFYARLAQHWRNNRPVTCPVYTQKAFGGNSNAPCPICELSERLNESGDDAIRDLGYQARCVLRYRVWCVVFDKEDARGKIEEMPDEELLNPYEFDMYKTTWEDFKKYQRWATTRRKGGGEPSELGVLDLETGCNLLATHGTKGVRLDRQELGPIFDPKDPDWDAKIGKIWARLRKPTITIASERQLLEMAVKFEEDTESGGGRRTRTRDSGGSRGGYRRGEEDDDRGGRRNRFTGEDDDDSDRPGTRSSRSTGGNDEAPSTRRSSRDEAPAEDDRRAPAREESRSAAPPPRRRVVEEDDRPKKPVTQRDLEKDQIPGAEVPARREAPAVQEEAPATLAPVRRSVEAPAPPTRRNTPVQEEAPAPPTRHSAPAPQENDAPAPPARRQAESSVEEEEGVPEERRDPAPPMKEKVEEPPATSAVSPPPTRGSSDLKARLDRITKKGQ